MVCNPDKVIFAKVATLQGCFQLIPAAYACKANRLTTSVALDGWVNTVAVVKLPAAGVIPPITELSIVLFVMCKPDC